MKTINSPAAALMALAIVCLALPAPATVFWTGPFFTFSHAAFATNADALTTNHIGTDITNNVWLTRGTSQPLYNSAAESAWSGSDPSHTLWVLITNTNAFPLALANTNTLHYDTFANVVGHPGSSPRFSVNKLFYVHILPDDIYLSLTLTEWGNNDGGSFAYVRTTPPPPTPVVSITNPVSGSLFVTPANLTIQAAASEAAGSITNVQFFVGSRLLANVMAAPFSATTNNLPAGNYTLTAIASDAAGLTATNAVNITVDTPPSITITNPVNNRVLAAPANLTIQASASGVLGTITNVQILIGPTVLTNVATSPPVAMTNGVGAGNYAISAVAYDNYGVMNTNSISISVVTPVAVALANAAPTASTNFQFSYAANVGLSYVVQFTTNLSPPNWISLATNVAASNPVVFVDTGETNHGGFYRVGRLPNP